MADDPSACTKKRTAEFEGTTSPSQARDVARGFLAGLRPPPGDEAAAAVVLAVCELVTNAARHAGGTITLTLTAGSDAVEIEVSDRSPQLPAWRKPDFAGGGGFGWNIIHSLASSVTTIVHPADGKTIRALIPTRGVPEEADHYNQTGPQAPSAPGSMPTRIRIG